MTFLILLFSLLPGVNTIVECNTGYYVDVKPAYYATYEPIEKLTKNYIQIDCNY